MSQLVVVVLIIIVLGYWEEEEEEEKKEKDCKSLLTKWSFLCGKIPEFKSNLLHWHGYTQAVLEFRKHFFVVTPKSLFCVNFQVDQKVLNVIFVDFPINICRIYSRVPDIINL